MTLTDFLMLLFELVIATTLIHFALLRSFPYIMYVIAKKMTVKKFNKLRYFDLPTPQNKTKMPSPEILYSLGFYDVRKRNVKISGEIPEDTYWSIALHTDNSVNFLTKNDQQYPGKKLDMLLVKQDWKDISSNNVYEGHGEIVQVPSQKGIVVLRILQPDYINDDPVRFHDIQRSIKMEVTDC